MTLREYKDNIIELQKRKDYASAYTLLQEALYYYPSNSFLQSSEIYLLLRLNRVKEARQRAEIRFTTLKDNAFFLRTYIEILLKDKDKKEILNLSERLKFSPIKDEKLYTFLAGVLLRLKEKQKAKELINLALSYMPESKEISSFLNHLRSGLGDEGIDYYRERYRGVPIDGVIKEIEDILILPDYGRDISLRLFLGELYKKKGDLKKASEVYLECLKLKNSLYVRKMLGYVYYKMNEFDKALSFLKDVFLTTPTDYALYNTIAKIIEKTGNITEGEALINKALETHPEAKHLFGILKRLRKIQIKN